MAVLPDFSAESRLVAVPAAEIVAMRSSQTSYVDQSGSLGLGNGDLVDLRLPSFQRGLKWDSERLRNFHSSLLQGWPVGVMVIAVERSEIINSITGQRRYALSLIDGQQRSWALWHLLERFWHAPWFTFSNPKWAGEGEPGEEATGSVADASRALVSLAHAIGTSTGDLDTDVRALAESHGEQAFDDYMNFLHLIRVKYADLAIDDPQVRLQARRLCDSILQQRADLSNVKIPVLLLGEALQTQLPLIFRRLNEGVPLKGYDLLAAQWEGERLSLNTPPNGAFRTLLDRVLNVASTRIQDTYELVESGYEVDPNQEPLRHEDLSLFDLLYFLSKEMAKDATFVVNDNVFAFQVAALASEVRSTELTTTFGRRSPRNRLFRRPTSSRDCSQVLART